MSPHQAQCLDSASCLIISISSGLPEIVTDLNIVFLPSSVSLFGLPPPCLYPPLGISYPLMILVMKSAMLTARTVIKSQSVRVIFFLVFVDPCFPFDTPINISYNERKQRATPPCALLPQKFDKPLYNFKNQHQQCYLVRS